MTLSYENLRERFHARSPRGARRLRSWFMQDREAELSDAELRAGQHQGFDFAVRDASVGSQTDFDFSGFLWRDCRAGQLLFETDSLDALIAEPPHSFGRDRDDESFR